MIENGRFIWLFVDTAAMLNPFRAINPSQMARHIHGQSLGKQGQHDGLHMLHTVCHFRKHQKRSEA